MSTTDRASLARETLLDIIRTSNLIDRRGGAIARPASITNAQWQTLSLLSKVGEEGLTPTELCRALCVSKQNMTGMVVRLEKKGLVGRRPEPNDRRSFRVFATGEGLSCVEELAEEGRLFYLRQVADLDDETLNALNGALGTVLSSLQAEEEGRTVHSTETGQTASPAGVLRKELQNHRPKPAETPLMNREGISALNNS